MLELKEPAVLSVCARRDNALAESEFTGEKKDVVGEAMRCKRDSRRFERSGQA